MLLYTQGPLVSVEAVLEIVTFTSERREKENTLSLKYSNNVTE